MHHIGELVHRRFRLPVEFLHATPEAISVKTHLATVGDNLIL